MRGLVSELELTAVRDGLPSLCIVNFDNNLHTLPKEVFRRRVAVLSAARMRDACQVLWAATGC